MLTLTFLVIVCEGIRGQDVSSLVDAETLSELPLGKLLEVRNSFEDDPEDLDLKMESRGDPEIVPVPQALQYRKAAGDRGGHVVEVVHYEDEHEKGGGGGKKNSIFQIAVTTLSFLAFGGYLLCLIVQALKGKQQEQMTQMQNMQAMAAFLQQRFPPPTRYRPNRRPTRTRKVQNNKNKRKNRLKNKRTKRDDGDDIGEDMDVEFEEKYAWPNVDPANMYHNLVSLSESYAIYNTMDLRNYNYSRNYFQNHY